MIQGSEETSDFLQRLVSAVNKAISDPNVSQMLIETLVFESANAECKNVRTLVIQAVFIDVWTRDMTNIGYDVFRANIMGQAIARGL